MGIKDYVKFVKSEYARACRKRWLSRYTHLYIDLNHALHNVCYKSHSSREILSGIKSYLNKIINNYRPTQRVYIGADGPAPIAKMVLQRKRRYDKVKTLKSNEDLNLTKNLSLNFTPGTEFMLNLADELKHFSSYLSIAYGVEVELDIEHDDEGEVKVRRKIEEDQKDHPNLTAIVYSGDADMILLLVSLKRLHNIYQIVDKTTVLSFGQLYNIHVQKFSKGSSYLMRGDDIQKIKRKQTSIKNDFIFINLLFGNDYLPKILYIRFDNIWKAYSEMSSYYPNGLIQYSRPNRTITIDREFMFRLIDRTTRMNKSNWDNKFKLSDLKPTDMKLYSNYMRGVAWCFDMYSSGICSDYRYIYDHSTPPHYDGIILQIMSQNTYTVPQTKSIDSDLYGILLIPEKAKPLLSEKQKKLAEKLVKIHPIIYEEERCQKCSIFSKSLSNYNKQASLLRSDSTTDSDLFDHNLIDADELSSDPDDFADAEKRARLKEDILEKIRDLNVKYAKHRVTHDTMTLKKIEKIEGTFSKLSVD
jgi:XRN 5'-3' exonuclease N-terminus